MPGGIDGLETMMEIRKMHAEAAIVIITAYATVDTAITAMKEGAQEYIVKPCNPSEISLLVSRIIKVKNLQRENVILRQKLTRHFIERLSHVVGKEMGDIFAHALKLLLDYDWPGNVRELEYAVERAIVTCRTGVLAEDDFAFLNHNKLERRGWAVPTSMTLDDVEKEVVATTLQRTQGNIKEAATILGIVRSTLYEKIKRYHIER